MFTTLSRAKAIKAFPSLPQHCYDANTDEDHFTFPDIASSYILSLPSKTFRGHIRSVGIELQKLCRLLGTDKLAFMGDTVLPWIYLKNEYNPVQKGMQFLMDNGVGKRFNGALQLNVPELPVFVSHLGWLTRCNALQATVYFVDPEQALLGSVCKYGNLHVDLLDKTCEVTFKQAVAQTKFIFLQEMCSQTFGKSSAIAGRRIVV